MVFNKILTVMIQCRRQETNEMTPIVTCMQRLDCDDSSETLDNKMTPIVMALDISIVMTQTQTLQILMKMITTVMV